MSRILPKLIYRNQSVGLRWIIRISLPLRYWICLLEHVEIPLMIFALVLVLRLTISSHLIQKNTTQEFPKVNNSNWPSDHVSRISTMTPVRIVHPRPVNNQLRNQTHTSSIPEECQFAINKSNRPYLIHHSRTEKLNDRSSALNDPDGLRNTRSHHRLELLHLLSWKVNKHYPEIRNTIQPIHTIKLAGSRPVDDERELLRRTSEVGRTWSAVKQPDTRILTMVGAKRSRLMMLNSKHHGETNVDGDKDQNTSLDQLPQFIGQWNSTTLNSDDNSSNRVSLLHSGVLNRFEQRRVVVIDRPEVLGSGIIRPITVQSIPDRSYYIEDGNGSDPSEERFPVLSFQYVEPHTIELLVVVTEKMRQKFGTLLNDYLASTMTTVSSLLRHPSLKTSINLNIVDIILLDRVYASHHNLEDWSYSKQEQVMAKFCRWVSRLRRPNFNWDSAILLNVGHFKSTALGVAHYRSMCSEESACLAVLDRGFGTGYIIAHELGHQLGAKHDFEVNSDCGMEEQLLNSDLTVPTTGMLGTVHGTSVDEEYDYPQSQWHSTRLEDMVRRDTLMSGTLYFDNFPLRWSACSRQAIHDFLESNMASCLRREAMPTPLHASDWLAKRSQHDLPGAIFSLDQQCQFVLKVHNTRFCGHMLPVCRQLYCEDAENGACLPMEAAWAEGSNCGESKWCLQGHCVPHSQKPVRVEGNWGRWGSWSACSRSCGGGVRFSERECNNPEPQNGGSFCHGTRTRMRSCAVQQCEKADNIRQQLCDKVGKQYGRTLEAYIPKLGEAAACSLTCLDGVHAVHHELSIPDGTPCYAQRDDICIKGRCWETGCDGVLGSKQRFDRCRVCGGDNSTCVEIKGVFNGDSVNSIGVQQRGLITAVRIPRGVTNAYVRKLSPRKTPYSSDSYDDFMLLIFEELKTQIRRGETREPFAGAELYYSGSRRSEEVVSITGRLQKDVNIVIRVENSMTTRSLPTIEYHYYVDKSERHNPLYFIAEEEARLAAQMANRRADRSGLPKKTMDVPIQPSSNNLAEGRSDFESQSETKQRPKLHFVWRISELPSGCSTCAGNATSHAECYPLVDDDQMRKQFHPHDFHRPVADYLCGSIPRPPPVVRQCSDYCGVRWAVRPHSTHEHSCSVRCGEGIQAAVHVCEEFIVPAEQPDKTKGHWREAQLGERACIRAGLGSAPRTVETVPCHGSCRPVFWVLSNWTKCSGSCSYGERRRGLRCQEANGYEWPLAECYSQAQVASHADGPEGAVSKDVAERIMLQHDTFEHALTILQSQLVFEESEACLTLTDCVKNIHWTTSDWSPCVFLNDEMKVICRSVDIADSYPKPSFSLIGMRTRQVYCQLHVANLHSSLRQYATDQSAIGPPYLMNLEFCRTAHAYGNLAEEPTNRESCERPFCYRWGGAKLSECSVSCGQGHRSVTIPCERVTLDLVNGPSDVQQTSVPKHWIETVSQDECHKQLGYSPRLFLTGDNTTVHVETVERPFNGADGKEIHVTSLSQPIQVNCINSPCTMSIPVWHTTGWEKCSVSCGRGTRKRGVMCMLETHVQPANHRPYTVPENSVVSTSRLNVVPTDDQRCLEARLQKPSTEEPCNEGPCPQWLPDAWGKCEGVCEYGIQRRSVRCVLDVSEVKAVSTASVEDLSQALHFAAGQARHPIRKHRSVQLIEVPSDRCQGAGPKPTTQRLCLLTSGCPFWSHGDWSSCSVECGSGHRHRTVSCRFPNGTLVYNAHAVPENPRSTETRDLSLDGLTYLVDRSIHYPACFSPRPVEKLSCKTRPCTGNTPFWWPVMASECDSTTCAVGRRNRVIVCLSSTHGPIADSNCRHLTRPNEWTPCVPRNCMNFYWSADPWTACPRGCGVRTRYRKVRCMNAFGEEYSDSLCPAHLKPENWRSCPNRCTNKPRSCADIKHRFPSSKDGTFQILIGLSLTSIYCVDMETENPKEFITLRKVNFAKSTGFLQPNSESGWCPTSGDPTSPFPNHENYLDGAIPREIDTTNLSTVPHWFYTEVASNNCPTCPNVPHLASVTYYEKIRLELTTLKIDVEDTRFAYTVGSSPVPYGTAKDCFGSTTCPQGRFQIDLQGTGFRVDVKTQWSSSNADTAIHIYRTEHGQLVTGYCGGRCSGCWPQPDLFVQRMEDGKH